MPRKRSSKLTKKTSPSATRNSHKPRKRKHKQTFSRYNYRVLRKVHPDSSISIMAMNVMNGFITDVFEHIAVEASRLAKHRGCVTITSREIQSAVKLLLTGELSKHAIKEGTEAVTRYTSSK